MTAAAVLDTVGVLASIDRRLTAMRRVAAVIGPVRVGAHVLVQRGPDQVHARVLELSINERGEPFAWVAYRTSPGWMHAVSLDSLTLVCGECEDCRDMNHRPGCLG